MFWHRRYILPFLILAGNAQAAGGGYIVGIGGEADTEEGRSLSVFGELATGKNTWISAAAAKTRTDGAQGGLQTTYADVQIDHWFEPVGVRLAVAYRGDSDVLDSVDVRTSVYVKDTRYSVSADFERRNYTFDFGLPRERRTAEFSANGFGFSGRLQTGDRVSVYLGGTWYDYSRNLRLQPGIDDLRFLSLTRLSLTNSLLDRKIHAGVEVEFGTRSLDIRFANWRTAADQGRIDSIGIGLLTPLGASGDIEFRLSRDRSDTFGDSTVFSVLLYFFGG